MILNVHNHYFTADDVAKNIFGWNVKPLVTSKVGNFLSKKVLKVISCFTSKHDRVLKVVEIAGMTTKEIFLKQYNQYPAGTQFVGIAIDMEYMNAGKVKRKYKNQVKDLFKLSKSYPVLPFIHIDPRRDYIELFENCVKKGLKGVKLYPAMGYRPDDKRLNYLYRRCQELNLPIIVHSGEQSPTHYKASKKRLKRLLEDSNVPYNNKMNKRQLCGQFGHPRYYKKLLEKYDVRFCFAHMGGGEAVNEYIISPREDNVYKQFKELCRKYRNAYMDISFTMHDRRLWYLLKVLISGDIGDKILFGSDYYMSKVEVSEKSWSVELRAFMGEKKYKKINKNSVIFVG